MRVVGQHRQPVGRAAAGDDPGVGAVAGPGQQVDEGRVSACRRASAPLPSRIVRRVARMGGEEARGQLGAQAFREADAQRLLAPVARQRQPHRLQPGDAVGGPPGLRPVGQQQRELRCQRPPVAGHEGVDAVGIGHERGARLGLQGGDAALGRAIEPQHPQETIELQGQAAQYLRAASLGHAPLRFHLEQPVPGRGRSPGRNRRPRPIPRGCAVCPSGSRRISISAPAPATATRPSSTGWESHSQTVSPAMPAARSPASAATAQEMRRTMRTRRRRRFLPVTAYDAMFSSSRIFARCPSRRGTGPRRSGSGKARHLDRVAGEAQGSRHPRPRRSRSCFGRRCAGRRPAGLCR